MHRGTAEIPQRQVNPTGPPSGPIPSSVHARVCPKIVSGMRSRPSSATAPNSSKAPVAATPALRAGCSKTRSCGSPQWTRPQSPFRWSVPHGRSPEASALSRRRSWTTRWGQWWAIRSGHLRTVREARPMRPTEELAGGFRVLSRQRARERPNRRRPTGREGHRLSDGPCGFSSLGRLAPPRSTSVGESLTRRRRGRPMTTASLSAG